MPAEARYQPKTGLNRLIGGALVVAVLYFTREFLIPIALAALLSFLLTPFASRLQRWGLGKTPAALLVVVLAFSGLSVIGFVVVGQVYNLALELPQYQQNVRTKLQSLHLDNTGKLTRTRKMMAELGKEISRSSSAAPRLSAASPLHGQTPRVVAPANADTSRKTAEPVMVRIEEPDPSVLAVAISTVTPLLHPLTTAFIVIVFVVFMLLGRDNLRDRAIRLAGSTRMHVTTVAMEDAGRRVSRYLLMQFVVNTSIGAVAGLVVWAIGIPHPLLWGVLACLLRFVPYIGIWVAAAGPLLLAIAVFPGWTQTAVTLGLFGALEFTAGNIVEPLLYGSSTGISAIAILIAAIFWTWLWGLPGLLLSTPLTVCLVVVGRYVPHLEFLGVLFGEETVLDPPQRFYQRVLAADTRDALKMIDKLLETKPREEVYDTVLIPAMTMIEEARHSEEISSSRAEQMLQHIEELVEAISNKFVPVRPISGSLRKVVCFPARDFADEIACELLMTCVSEMALVRVLQSDVSTSDLLDLVAMEHAEVICVVGVPPQAMRHVRLRCRQLRSRFPDLVAVACVLSVECSLSDLRSRVAVEDAQHVVCSLQQAKEYLLALTGPLNVEAHPNETSRVDPEHEEERPEELKDLDALDLSAEDLFDRITSSLAKQFEAPIALISVVDERRRFWKAHSGLPSQSAAMSPDASFELSICNRVQLGDSSMVIPDVAEDPRFKDDPFLIEKGIRFYAGIPLVTHDGTSIGSVCILDTRPRQISEYQKELLQKAADSVINAIELHETAEEEKVSEPSILT